MDGWGERDVRFPEADEIDGFWAQDRIHAPRPLSPLAFDLITDTLAIGFTRAHVEYGAPLDMFTRQVNHYLYSSLRPVTDEAELARRAERYAELPRMLDEVGPRWAQEWQPRLIDQVHTDRVRDYRPLTNDELADELEHQRQSMLDQWTIHGRINFGTVAGARFADFYTETFEPFDASEPYQLLQGFITQTVRASQELWSLSRLVRSSPTLSELLARPDDQVLSALDLPSPPDAPLPVDVDDDASSGTDASPGAETAAFGRRFQAFLDVYGWRSDAVYDVADVTWREDPSIPLDSLRGYLGLDDSHDPDLAFARAAARREELLAQARATLADDPERSATFERYYEAGRHNLVITEDHAFWIDQSGVANIRRFLLQVGERLVADGGLDRADDVFYLHRPEVDDALRYGGDRRAVVAERRASLAAAARTQAPATLGTPPAPAASTQAMDPLLDAIAVRLAGRRPPQEVTADTRLLTGHAASGGVATGTARVVRSLADAAKLGPGEILVCEMTLPPWVPLFAVAAAVVADTGGLMSHCAIVAREFGLPAVVGTQHGTRIIVDGATITVDGDKGEVHLS